MHALAAAVHQILRGSTNLLCRIDSLLWVRLERRVDGVGLGTKNKQNKKNPRQSPSHPRPPETVHRGSI